MESSGRRLAFHQDCHFASSQLDAAIPLMARASCLQLAGLKDTKKWQRSPSHTIVGLMPRRWRPQRKSLTYPHYQFRPFDTLLSVLLWKSNQPNLTYVSRLWMKQQIGTLHAIHTWTCAEHTVQIGTVFLICRRWWWCRCKCGIVKDVKDEGENADDNITPPTRMLRPWHCLWAMDSE